MGGGRSAALGLGAAAAALRRRHLVLARRRAPRCGAGIAVRTALAATVEWPAEVEGYSCRPVVAEVPGLGPLAALVVDEASGASADEAAEELPDWIPKAWLNPVMGDGGVGDVYGAIGVWPAAFVAGEALRAWAAGRAGPWRCVEIGCGAGFPALLALRLGASVLAVDVEPLPLALLRAAAEAQQECGSIPAGAELETLCGQAGEVPLEGADVVVVSDLLYSVELGREVGLLLGEAVRNRGCHLVLTDGGRSGRASFLEAFVEALGSPAHFEDTPIPSWAPERVDLFDGEERATISVLKY